MSNCTLRFVRLSGYSTQLLTPTSVLHYYSVEFKRPTKQTNQQLDASEARQSFQATVPCTSTHSLSTPNPNKEIGNAGRGQATTRPPCRYLECVGSPSWAPLEWARRQIVRTQGLYGCCRAEAVGTNAEPFRPAVGISSALGIRWSGPPRVGAAPYRARSRFQMVTGGAMATKDERRTQSRGSSVIAVTDHFSSANHRRNFAPNVFHSSHSELISMVFGICATFLMLSTSVMPTHSVSRDQRTARKPFRCRVSIRRPPLARLKRGDSVHIRRQADGRSCWPSRRPDLFRRSLGRFLCETLSLHGDSSSVGTQIWRRWFPAKGLSKLGLL